MLPAFLDGVEAALHRAGITTRRASVEFDTTEVILQKIASISAHATLGLNAIVDEPELQHIPHIYWGCDLGFNYVELLHTENCIPCLMDEDSCKLFQCHGKEAHFLPHAFAKELLDACRLDAFNEERPLEVVAPFSLFDEAPLLQLLRSQLPSCCVELLLEAKQLAVSDSSTPHYLILFQALESNVKVKKLFEESIGILEAVRILDFLVRGHDRNALLAAVGSKYQVHVFAPEADHEKIEKKLDGNFVLRAPVNFYDLKDILLQARFLLNSVPTIKRGFHERLFYGLACGCTVISNQSAYLPSKEPSKYPWSFSETDYLLSYSASDLPSLLQKMSRLPPRRSIKQLQEVHDQIASFHTWDSWVNLLLNKIYL